MAESATARRILVVDDEPLVCDSVRRMLKSYGHDVEVASSAQEGLALFQNGRFDLIVIDYLMPGMKGDEMATAIRARAGTQPIVIISAAAEMLQTDGKSSVDADTILSKPFQLEELREAVNSVLARHSAAQ